MKIFLKYLEIGIDPFKKIYMIILEKDKIKLNKFTKINSEKNYNQ